MNDGPHYYAWNLLQELLLQIFSLGRSPGGSFVKGGPVVLGTGPDAFLFVPQLSRVRPSDRSGLLPGVGRFLFETEHME